MNYNKLGPRTLACQLLRPRSLSPLNPCIAALAVTAARSLVIAHVCCPLLVLLVDCCLRSIVGLAPRELRGARVWPLLSLRSLLCLLSSLRSQCGVSSATFEPHSRERQAQVQYSEGRSRRGGARGQQADSSSTTARSAGSESRATKPAAPTIGQLNCRLLLLKLSAAQRSMAAE